MWGTHNMAILPPRLLTSFDTAGLCAVSVVHMTVSIWCVVSPMQIPFKWQTHQPNGTQFNCIIITDHSAYYMANYSYLWAITTNHCPACLLHRTDPPINRPIAIWMRLMHGDWVIENEWSIHPSETHFRPFLWWINIKSQNESQLTNITKVPRFKGW